MAGLFGALDRGLSLSDEELAELEAQTLSGLNNLSARLGVQSFVDTAPVPHNAPVVGTPFGGIPNAAAIDPNIGSHISQEGRNNRSDPSLYPGVGTRNTHQAAVPAGALNIDEIEQRMQAIEEFSRRSEQQYNAAKEEAHVARALDAIGFNPQVEQSVPALSAIDQNPLSLDIEEAISNYAAAAEQQQSQSEIAAALAMADIEQAVQPQVAVDPLAANPLGLDLAAAIEQYEAPELPAVAMAISENLSPVDPAAVAADPDPASQLAAAQTMAGNAQNAREATGQQSAPVGAVTEAPGFGSGLNMASLDDAGMSSEGLGADRVGDFASMTNNPGPGRFSAPIAQPVSFSPDFSTPAQTAALNDVGTFGSFGAMGSVGSQSLGSNGVQGVDVGFSHASPVSGLMGEMSASPASFSAQQSNPTSNFSQTAAPTFSNASFSPGFSSNVGNAVNGLAGSVDMSEAISNATNVSATNTPAAAAPAPAVSAASTPAVAAAPAIQAQQVTNLAPLSMAGVQAALNKPAAVQAPVANPRRGTITQAVAKAAAAPGLRGSNKFSGPVSMQGMMGMNVPTSLSNQLAGTQGGGGFGSMGASQTGYSGGFSSLAAEQAFSNAFDETRSGDLGQGPSASAQGNCYIATDAVENGSFSLRDKAKAEVWCKKRLHGHWAGETVRLGYQTLAKRAVRQGRAERHYGEFQRFVKYGRGLDKTLKGAATFYGRMAQFFAVGLAVQILGGKP